MADTAILWPLLIQILLTLAAYIALAMEKKRAVKNGEVDESRRGLYDDAWPERVLKINNNIRNQFELPVLFYVLVLLSWQLHATGTFALVVAWLFALSRILHAYIHTGSNYVPLRRNVFLFGCLMVLLLSINVSRVLLAG